MALGESQRAAAWLIATGLLSSACGSAPPAAQPDPCMEKHGATQGGEQPEAAAMPEPPTAPTLESVLQSAHRLANHSTRDVYRHPAETLQFFGIEPTMHVIELRPSGGWYTEILAPYLREEGVLAIAFPADSPYEKDLLKRRETEPEVFDKLQVIDWNPPQQPELGAADSVDAVVTFRNIHGWYNHDQLSAVLASTFAVLKPGGILGVVQHRANAEAELEESAKNGYMPEAAVIEAAEAAGFELEARSEVNANPKDTKDHPKGVWTLPPTLRLGDENKDQWLAIGESDRMTLRFRKPTPLPETSEESGPEESGAATP